MIAAITKVVGANVVTRDTAGFVGCGVPIIGLQRGEVLFRQVVQTAMRINCTRDPFDRLIVAEAEAAGGRLVSKDSTIRENSQLAVW
jgi:hypothetical protein